MRTAIHAADLDHDRIDGTRVYLLNMLKNFGLKDKENSFFIYHQFDFNPNLAPPTFPNYIFKKIPFGMLWTQTRFAWELFWDNPDVLWMPVHNMPIFRRKSLKTVVTIHDLAFKIFPEYFPKNDLIKLNRLSDLAINNSNKIIAVSEATKKDILKFYPKISPEKITVIHHGFDSKIFQQEISQERSDQIVSKFKIFAPSLSLGQNSKFLLYVGAIQPRKNLSLLIEAFEKIKENHPEMKLVLAGAPAWKFESTLKKIDESIFKNDIIVTGTLPFSEIAVLYKNAEVFVFPSIYEGFGIPILEAFASGVPVVCGHNSSLIEVAGDSALFFDTNSCTELCSRIEQIFDNPELKKELIDKGKERVKNFTWEKCATATLDVIKN